MRRTQEVLLDTLGHIHSHPKSAVGGFRVIYQNTFDRLDAGETFNAYWHIGGEHKGKMYTRGRSRNFGNSWIILYTKNALTLSGMHYISHDGGEFKSYNCLDKTEQDLDKNLVIDIIKQMYMFQSKLDCEIYKDDIEILRGQLCKWDNSILDTDLGIER